LLLVERFNETAPVKVRKGRPHPVNDWQGLRTVFANDGTFLRSRNEKTTKQTSQNSFYFKDRERFPEIDDHRGARRHSRETGDRLFDPRQTIKDRT
jgi:hypothetical protein